MTGQEMLFRLFLSRWTSCRLMGNTTERNTRTASSTAGMRCRSCRAIWVTGPSHPPGWMIGMPSFMSVTSWLVPIPWIEKPELPGYISYGKGSAGTGADTVKSSAYYVASNEEGWIDLISIAPDFKRNRIDRLKLRLAGSSITLTENLLKAQEDPSTFHKKPIRSFHDRRYNLHIDEFPALKASVDPSLHFLPYSFKTGVQDAELESPLLLSIFGVNSLRQSLDFSPQSTGMKFYSAKNRNGVAIDGS